MIQRDSPRPVCMIKLPCDDHMAGHLVRNWADSGMAVWLLTLRREMSSEREWQRLRNRFPGAVYVPITGHMLRSWLASNF